MNRVRKKVSGNEYSVKQRGQASQRSVMVGLKRLSAKYSVLLVVAFLAGCASTGSRVEQSPAEVEERVLVDGKALPFPEDTRIKTESLDGTPTLSNAVKNLLDDSIEYKRAENYDAAAEALERALRIEPRNPAVWHELADLRLVRQEYQQAIQFAQKSNALTQADAVSLKRRNWNLIAIAYSALGNTDKAAEYRAKLRE